MPESTQLLQQTNSVPIRQTSRLLSSTSRDHRRDRFCTPGRHTSPSPFRGDHPPTMVVQRSRITLSKFATLVRTTGVKFLDTVRQLVSQLEVSARESVTCSESARRIFTECLNRWTASPLSRRVPSIHRVLRVSRKFWDILLTLAHSRGIHQRIPEANRSPVRFFSFLLQKKKHRWAKSQKYFKYKVPQVLEVSTAFFTVSINYFLTF